MSVTPPEINNPGTSTPEVINTEDLSSIIFDSNNQGFETAISDTTQITSAETLKQADVQVTSEKSDSVRVDISAERVKGSTFNVEGRGGLDMNIMQGVFKRNTINGGGGADSIRFGNETTVGKGVKINLNKGPDTVTFSKETRIRGINNVIDAGNDRGSDVIKFRSDEPNFDDNAKLTIKNFGPNDKIIVGTGADQKTYSQELGNLNEDTFDNIVIKFQE